MDNQDNMTLMQEQQEIAQARRDRNLFVLDLSMPNKIMQTTLPPRVMTAQGRGRSTHIVSTNKRVRVWHRRMGHASNARIIQASKLLTEMGNFNAKYNPAKIYSDSKQSQSDSDDDAMKEGPELLIAFGTHFADNNFDSLCISCLASKQPRVVN